MTQAMRVGNSCFGYETHVLEYHETTGSKLQLLSQVLRLRIEVLTTNLLTHLNDPSRNVENFTNGDKTSTTV
ncbi:MAG: hypothetical protein ACRC62_32865, partial [Microcoleus sp.]